MLTDCVRDEKSKPNSNMFKCKLGKKYIDQKAKLLEYPAFEKGVVKLQSGLHDRLSPAERQATAALKIELSPPIKSSSDYSWSKQERAAKRKKENETGTNYTVDPVVTPCVTSFRCKLETLGLHSSSSLDTRFECTAIRELCLGRSIDLYRAPDIWKKIGRALEKFLILDVHGAENQLFLIMEHCRNLKSISLRGRRFEDTTAIVNLLRSFGNGLEFALLHHMWPRNARVHAFILMSSGIGYRRPP